MAEVKDIKTVNQADLFKEVVSEPGETAMAEATKPRVDRRFRVKREDLVRGIILREILGPPKALER
ncbi:MAG: hypothetical protein R6W99_01375 [Clostridia bacterium]